MVSGTADDDSTVFINEVEYNHGGGREGNSVDRVEIAGPAGTDLSKYKIKVFNERQPIAELVGGKSFYEQ